MSTGVRWTWRTIIALCLPVSATAQRVIRLPTASPADDEAHRTSLLLGWEPKDAVESTRLLRSASSLAAPGRDSAARMSFVAPVILAVTNSGLPYSYNDGALWSGRGTSGLLRAGVTASSGRLHVVIAPEVAISENRDFVAFSPDLPPGFALTRPGRSPFAAPWYYAPRNADAPWRFGTRHYARLEPGQSSAWIALPPGIDAGVSTENEWWGPGIRNALLLSDNAPGFPHLFARSRRPLQTRIGTFDARWLLGGLAESAFFDTVSSNDRRSFSAAAVVWRAPHGSPVDGLSVGIGREVIANARSWAGVLRRPLDFLASAPRSANVADSTTRDTTAGGRDQITSIFWQWAFPGAGFEFYGEVGRTELPVSLRDFLLYPDHSRGYTVGLQWIGNPAANTHLRVQAEATNIERASSFLSRPIGIWYASRAVPQGFTHRGQTLGAAIGPGASSQWLALDYLARTWDVGLVGQRVRWNNDAMYFAVTFDPTIGAGWCQHDVTIAPGVRGGASTRLGRVQGELLLQNRLNVFFQNAGGCPNNEYRRDLRNVALTIRYAP